MALCHPDRRYHAKDKCYQCYVGGWVKQHPERVREYRRTYVPSDAAREKKLLYKRNGHFQRQYGMTLGEVDAQIARQGGLCAICHRPPTSSPPFRSSRPRLLVDHDHESGKVRGLLCTDCNAALGHFDDNPDFLRAAIAYLNCPPLLEERG